MTDQIAKGTVVLGEDFQAHRIVGYVPGSGAYLNAPLITQVKDNLWQGGCMNRVKLPDEFDYVLSLYPWEKYKLGPTTDRDEITMYDSLEQSIEQVDELAEDVVRRLSEDQTVLIHCQAGLNRSGLVTASVLVKLGMSGPVAIDLLRKQRSPLVLCNETFEYYVRQLNAEHHCASDCCGECV